MARITRTSIVSGLTRTMEFDQYTQDDFEKRFIAWKDGKIEIDDAFPLLSLEAREFIKSGISRDEWERYVSSYG